MCRYRPGGEGPDIWIEVAQPHIQPPPAPPDVLRPWLKPGALDDSSQDAPSVFDAIQRAHDPTSSEEPRWVEFRERPDVGRAYDEYVDQRWWPWAERDRTLRRQQQVYTDLFRLHQSQQRLGEAYEVVMGLGHLAWRTASGGTIRRHLVVAQSDVRFDSRAGLITVVAAVDGARPVLEQDMLEPDERPPAGELDRISSILSEVGDDLFSDAGLGRGFQTWVHAASSQGRYEGALERQGSATDQPVVHLAPALILRRRTERSIVQALQAIITHLQHEGAYVPAGVRQLVGIVEDGEVGDDRAGNGPPAAAEILFPLPANEEQLDIVRRLSGRPGVLVQGPPGTGKSHTIANLIAHLLAQGQRVLVTSHTARALEVLRAKVPPEIRQLAVVVLGNDISGREELRSSVMGIQRRSNSWNQRRSAEQVSSLHRALGQAREREAAAFGKLRALRESDSYRHPPCFGGYEGTAQEIGVELRRNAAEYNWITFDGFPESDCPLSREEVSALRRLLSEFDEGTERELELIVPDMTALPTPNVFAQLVDSERQTVAASAEVKHYRGHPAYGALRSAPADTRSALWSAAHDLATAQRALDQRPEPWVAAAVEQVLAGYPGRWRELARFTNDVLDAIGPRLPPVAHLQVTGLEGRDITAVLGDSRPLLDYLRRGKGWGAGPFRPAVVKRTQYVADQVRVDGVPCRDLGVLERLVTWLEVQAYLASLDAEWSPLVVVPTGSAGARASGYTDLLAALQAVLLLQPKVAAAAATASTLPGLPGQDWNDPGAVSGLVGAAAAAHRDAVWSEAVARLSTVEATLRKSGSGGQTHPAVDAMLDAVVGRDVDLYGQAYNAVAALASRKERVRGRDGLLSRLRQAAPSAVSTLLAEPELRDLRLATLHSAWDWARADRWLRQLADPSELRRMEREIDGSRQEIERLTMSLAAELAWAQTMGRLTETERQHLVAWETAVRRIGKGTGKMAPAWRARARQAMEGCRTAVPAWIMPIFKVAETVDIVPEAFDVVIVDEASQSGPEAFFLQFLARKVIVVGDDQQISPSNIGIERDKVELLNSQYVKDIPLGAFFNAENSLFDLAAIRYRDRIMLREHFRCMPEIIQFSNSLCYRDQPLIPLRQFGADRLTPAVQVRHIAEGYRSGDVNEPEANALIEQIVACLSDPAYDGKTFGVVSLVGPAQADYIRRLLIQQIEPAEIERRQIVCGEAYAFQGDERDVMFLSLVQAPGEGRRIAALNRDADKRRFNVAASRARDQMWLFHTATLNDLHPESIAYHLLDYCLHPGVESTPLRDISLEELRRRIEEHERGEPSPQPFDSWFEAEVFLRLADRGCHVIPQYPMADYVIDLVVEGLQGRLAVECDGDVWHGSEAFDRDAYRQRLLERCGMRFVRIRGSAFYRDPEAALLPLWGELRSRGIVVDGTKPEQEDEAPRGPHDPETPDDAETPPAPTGVDESASSVEEAVAPSGADDLQELKETAWTTPYSVARPASPIVWVDVFLPGADRDVRRIVEEVVDLEAPIAVELLVRRVRDTWHIGRAGSRVAEAVERQIDVLRRRGRIRVEQGFVWILGQELTRVRVPTADPATVREVEHVPPVEIREALSRIAMQSDALPRWELMRAAARVFGWRRVGPDIGRALDAHVAEMLREGLLTKEDGHLRFVGGGDHIPAAEAPVYTPRKSLPDDVPADAEPIPETSRPPYTQPPPEVEPRPDSAKTLPLPGDLDRCLTERGWHERLAKVKRLEARLEEARREADASRVAHLGAELSELRTQLEDVRVVARPTASGRALLGCRVEFRDNDGPPESWLLVPPLEADGPAGRLNVDTPFGRVLYGRQVGDRVELNTHDGHHMIEILAVEVD